MPVFTTDGTTTEKKNVFFTVAEYETLQEVADNLNQPIGNFIMQLAHEQNRRLKAIN